MIEHTRVTVVVPRPPGVVASHHPDTPTGGSVAKILTGRSCASSLYVVSYRGVAAAKWPVDRPTSLPPGMDADVGHVSRSPLFSPPPQGKGPEPDPAAHSAVAPSAEPGDAVMPWVAWGLGLIRQRLRIWVWCSPVSGGRFRNSFRQEAWTRRIG